ncbi:MAG: hypothetical protein QOJ67_953 [Acidimicrobiaceae bacterium]
MLVVMVKHWWSPAVRGAVAVLFGIVTLIWPGLTVWALVLLFGFFALLDGVSTLAAVATRDPETEGHRLYFFVIGLVSVGAAIIAFAWPSITALALLWVIAAWAFLSGVMEVALAIRLRKEISNEWLLGLVGLLSIAFAVMLVITPGAGALVITWLIAWYAIIVGVLLLALSWRLRKLQATVEQRVTSMRHASA